MEPVFKITVTEEKNGEKKNGVKSPNIVKEKNTI